MEQTRSEMKSINGCHPLIKDSKLAKVLEHQLNNSINESLQIAATLGYDMFTAVFKDDKNGNKCLDDRSRANNFGAYVALQASANDMLTLMNDEDKMRNQIETKPSKLLKGYGPNHREVFGDEPSGSSDDEGIVMKTAENTFDSVERTMAFFKDVNEKGVDLKPTMMFQLKKYYKPKDNSYDPLTRFGRSQNNLKIRSLGAITFNVEGVTAEVSKNRKTPRLIRQHIFGYKDKRSNNTFKKKEVQSGKQISNRIDGSTPTRSFKTARTNKTKTINKTS